jgi:hypothetical protein
VRFEGIFACVDSKRIRGHPSRKRGEPPHSQGSTLLPVWCSSITSKGGPERFAGGTAAASIFDRRAVAEAPGCDCDNGRGEPNPQDLARENSKTSIREKPPETNRGYVNGRPGKKIAVIVERGKESHSQSAVCHCVQETMVRGRQKDINPKRKSPQRRHASSEPDKRHGAGQKRCEKKGVCESAVTPEVAVMDPESKSDHVQVGDHRAGCPSYPDPFWRAGTTETGSDAKRSHHV